MKLGRTVLSFIAIVISFTIYGTYREHGDTNAGGMYGVIAIVPGAIISLVSYVLYYLVQLTAKYKNTSLKNYIHFLLGVVLIVLDPKSAIFIVLIIGLMVILTINLIGEHISV